MSTFNIEDYQKRKGVTKARAQQDVLDTLGRGANWFLEDFLKEIQEKSFTKSDKEGPIGKLLKNILGEKVGKAAKGAFRMFSSLNPVTAAINLGDVLLTNIQKQKDYDNKIKQIEALGMKIPDKYKNTFAENPLIASMAGGASQGIDVVSDAKKTEKLAGTVDAILSAIPVARNVVGKVAPNIGTKIGEYSQSGVEALTGSQKLGEIAKEAISGTGSLANKLTSPSYLDILPFKGVTTPGPFIPGAGKPAFYNLPSVSSTVSAFRPTLTDMLLEEPGDITMREIPVPRIRRRR